MKGSEILTGTYEGREVAVFLKGGRIDDLVIAPSPGSGPMPGTIFWALPGRVLKGQAARIVRLPGGQSGFLRQGGSDKPGFVQVTGFAEPGKAVPVTSRILLKGRYAILSPGSPGRNISRRIRDENRRAELEAAVHSAMEGAQADLGLIVRSEAEHRDTSDLTSEIAALRTLWTKITATRNQDNPVLAHSGPSPTDIAHREWPAPDTASSSTEFDARGISDDIDAFRSVMADLPGGGSIFVEPTRALIAVDVNTGADTSPAAALKTNLALADELPRQLRCRGLGGQIVLDLAPMRKADRRRFEDRLRSAFRRDPVDTALVGWTQLGHFELQRKRERAPL